MLPHAGVINRIDWLSERHPLNSFDKVLQKTPYVFDVSIAETFWPLADGAILVYIKPGGHAEPLHIKKLITQHGITVIHFVPSMLDVFCSMIRPDEYKDFESVRIAWASGEALTPYLSNEFHLRFRNCVLYDLYGPTETSIEVLFHKCQSSLQTNKPLPIGKPIANVKSTIRDDYMKQLPLTGRGELCISGIALGRGYLNQPTLTKKTFPIIDGVRWYRTGDLCRYTPNGDILYLGRIDYQVKIRGLRVELGEIESALRQHPIVREACCVVHKNSLAAYVVLQDADHSSESDSKLSNDVITNLKQKLPAYMVPTVTVLKDFPKLVSGKINRKQLPNPSSEGSTGGSCTAPETEVEIAIFDLFVSVLGLDGDQKLSFSTTTSFFDAGGHSLLAIKLIAALQKDIFSQGSVSLRTLFEYPSVKDLSILATSFNDNKLNANTDLIIPKAETSNLYPLSHAQHRLWVLSHIDTDGSAYNMPLVVEVVGQLDMNSLKEAFKSVITRHDVLRTGIVSSGMQKIVSPDEMNFYIREEVINNSSQLEGVISRCIQTCIPLDEPPLLRVTVVNDISDKRTYLITVVHHIVCDGWSLSILVKELLHYYKNNSFLEPLAVQYQDFSVWQNNFLNKKIIVEPLLEYWNDKLSCLPHLDFPTDFSRPDVQTFNGAAMGHQIESGVSVEIHQIGSKYGCTSFTTLLAIFKIVLSKYTNQTDIVVGSPIAGRNQLETQNLIGFFVNTLVMRTTLDDEDTFIDILKKVRQTCLDAYDHQELPFEMIVESLKPERDLSRNPLYQIVFLQNDSITGMDEAADSAGLSLKSVEMESHVAKFDMEISTSFSPETGTVLNIEYNTDLFTEKTIRNLCCHFECVMQSVVESPQKRLCEISLVSQSEIIELTNTVNQTDLRYPNECTHIYQLIKNIAIQKPDSTALVMYDIHYSYASLVSEVEKTAGMLSQKGLKSECIAAICTHRREEMIIVILAVVSLGCVYLPLDPTYPDSRLEYMLKDSNATHIITEQLLLNRVRENIISTDAMVISIDSDERSGSLMQQSVISLSSPAYLIYTSGSTGKPKGVLVSHRGLISLCQDNIKQNMTVNKRTMQFATCCFDASVWEIFTTLTSGGTLCLCVEDDRLGADLELYLRSQQIQSVLFPPSLLAVTSQFDLFSLETIVTGGEACSSETVQKWGRHSYSRSVSHNRSHHRRLINAYGPTENTVVATTHELHYSDTQTPIGLPISNCSCLVIQERSGNVNLCPIGVPGELVISGDQIAIEYLNRKSLTLEKFVSNPWSQYMDLKQQTDIMYKTGDLVKRDAITGSLIYMGRLDHQVKIRGFRVELGEIESKIRRSPNVIDSICTVDSDGNLVAYILHSADVDMDFEEIDSQLSESLPKYMLPSAYVFVTQFIYGGGKVDRKKLPKPKPSDFKHPTSDNAEDQFCKPSSELEWSLHAIWCTILSRSVLSDDDLISVNANFFDIGGHSLLAVKLLSEIQNELGSTISLKKLFDNPTIKSVSLELQNKPSIVSQIIPVLVRDEDSKPPLSYAQQQLWVQSIMDGEGVGSYTIPTSIAITGPLNVDKFKQAFTSVIKFHEGFRTIFMTYENGLPYQRIKPFIGDESYIEVLSDTDCLSIKNNFKLSSSERLFHAQLIQGRDQFVFNLNMHHIIADGWSVSVILEDICRLYAGNEILKSPIQYSDYSSWQRNGFESSESLRYWVESLKNPPLLELPSDMPRPMLQSFEGSVEKLVINDAELIFGIKNFLSNSKVTLFTATLAAFSILLNKYSNQNDFVIGVPIANREMLETQRVVGFFVNTVAVRVCFDDKISFSELVEIISKTMIKAQQHQNTPFDKVLEGLKYKRDPSRNPLFQVMYDLANDVQKELTIDDITLAPIDVPTQGAKFDLNVTATASKNVEEISFSFEYCTALFKKETIVGMTKCFKEILKSVFLNYKKKNSIVTINSVNMISEDTHHQIITEWNDTKRFDLNFKTSRIHDLCDNISKTYPDSIAMVNGDEVYSYEYLSTLTDLLACNFRKELKLPEHSKVGIHCPRSSQGVILMLSLWKAGLIYIPISLTLPADRVLYIANDCDMSCIISMNENDEVIKTLSSSMRIISYETLQSLGNDDSIDFNVSGDPNELAYILYTSGSTGKPKGVNIHHGGITNMVLAEDSIYNFTVGERVLEFASLSFDSSFSEIFMALITGGVLFFGDSPDQYLGDELLTYIECHRINTATLSPSVLALLNSSRSQSLKHLTTLILMGEALPVETMLEWFQPWRRFYNSYGPTECSVTTNIHLCTGRESVQVPIGMSLPNYTTYILDKNLNPVPPGAVGEIYHGGVGVAMGYVNLPDQTREKFILDPFHKNLNISGTMYKSGDLGKYTIDGNILFLGRIDHQVKIRGLRIELGEIEATIREVSSVKDCTVVVSEINSEKQLVAYFIPTESSVEEADAVNDIRSSVRMKLPPYMVPTYVIQIDSFPLTLSGKLDKKRLPEPGINHTNDSDLNYEEPLPGMESDIAVIWCEHFSVANIGRNNCFFECGGTSLSAVRLIAKLKRILKVPTLRLQTLFIHSTISELASEIALLQNDNLESIATHAQSIEMNILQSTLPNSHYPTCALLEVVPEMNDSIAEIIENRPMATSLYRLSSAYDTEIIMCIKVPSSSLLTKAKLLAEKLGISRTKIVTSPLKENNEFDNQTDTRIDQLRLYSAQAVGIDNLIKRIDGEVQLNLNNFTDSSQFAVLNLLSKQSKDMVSEIKILNSCSNDLITKGVVKNLDFGRVERLMSSGDVVTTMPTTSIVEINPVVSSFSVLNNMQPQVQQVLLQSYVPFSANFNFNFAKSNFIEDHAAIIKTMLEMPVPAVVIGRKQSAKKLVN